MCSKMRDSPEVLKTWIQESIIIMRLIMLITAISLSLCTACGEEPETEVFYDSTATQQPDSVEVQAELHTSPQDAITGAYNLIDDARTVTDEANARIEELEQLMGDN